MLELALKNLAAYLLGSIIGALLVGRLRGGVDIRTMGSGNAGGTNALRTQGPAFAFWVMFIDVGKGLLAVLVLAPMDLSNILPVRELFDAAHDDLWLQVTCATSVVVGHVFPLWHQFRGGKGAATLIGVLVGLWPLAVAPVLLVWATVLVTTGYVGLATLCATASFPILVMVIGGDVGTPLEPLLYFGLAMVLFVCFTHRANIARMLAGEEPRSQRMWLLRPRA